ncbi:MAG: pyridoxamine 5'-phosphate oxidase family protein [Spirochaetaceae bacterium]|jgi:nitroimidazol reductase NimA-like FMN-containing flavoprotein (pyridoxamine 5'-phosphate oxidase superfamily)|nr:pyridoxamine 5'-phosphate oxidase family protein [Spirochaetaceae bacterium]
MRRKDREITVIEEKMEIIAKNKVCRLGLSKDNFPYIVPLNYGYSFENNTLVLYFHGATEGKKMDIIKENTNACFEIDFEGRLIESENPCSYSYAFKSIIGFGKIIMMSSTEEKIAGLNKIMSHQTGKETIYDFPEDVLRHVAVYKMAVEEFTGKQKTK